MYSVKRKPVGAADGTGLDESGKGAGVRNRGSGLSMFVGWCDGLKSFIFDYGVQEIQGGFVGLH